MHFVFRLRVLGFKGSSGFWAFRVLGSGLGLGQGCWKPLKHVWASSARFGHEHFKEVDYFGEGVSGVRG